MCRSRYGFAAAVRRRMTASRPACSGYVETPLVVRRTRRPWSHGDDGYLFANRDLPRTTRPQAACPFRHVD